jgi:hypothetical protein
VEGAAIGDDLTAVDQFDGPFRQDLTKNDQSVVLHRLGDVRINGHHVDAVGKDSVGVSPPNSIRVAGHVDPNHAQWSPASSNLSQEGRIAVKDGRVHWVYRRIVAADHNRIGRGEHCENVHMACGFAGQGFQQNCLFGAEKLMQQLGDAALVVLSAVVFIQQ